MIYMIDSADLKAIKKLNDSFPISGVTTNPSIIGKNKVDLKTVIEGIRSIITNDKMLHIQTLSESANEIISEGKRIVDLAGENTYIKIPVTTDGIKAIMKLKKLGYRITATAIFTPQQALMAAAAGADFVAPYVNRLDNISSDGAEVAAEIVSLLKLHNMPCQVLAASFNNVEQIHKATLSGVTALTIQPDLFTKLIYHPLTDLAIQDFIVKGKELYNI